jgi:hypothetical protein
MASFEYFSDSQTRPQARKLIVTIRSLQLQTFFLQANNLFP